GLLGELRRRREEDRLMRVVELERAGDAAGGKTIGILARRGELDGRRAVGERSRIERLVEAHFEADVRTEALADQRRDLDDLRRDVVGGGEAEAARGERVAGAVGDAGDDDAIERVALQRVLLPRLLRRGIRTGR